MRIACYQRKTVTIKLMQIVKQCRCNRKAKRTAEHPVGLAPPAPAEFKGEQGLLRSAKAGPETVWGCFGFGSYQANRKPEPWLG
jgi:hypothetical protein